MYTAVPQGAPDVGAVRRGGSAFERNVLPGLTRWFLEQLERTSPDFLIPAETKGARILERVLAHASDVLGVAVRVPILYSTALAYADPDELSRSRALIVDDSVRTGQNLARHHRRVQEYGVAEVSAVACIGYAEDPDDLPTVPCYRLVSAELYREYAWQLAEFVVARGLPPEVDHHVFELRLPERLPLAWPTLAHALGRHGSLSVDAPLASDGDIVGMTLHFPRLPGTCEHPREGAVRIEGVSKARFFPDLAQEAIDLVPVSFPALDLPPATPSVLDLEKAWQLVRQWTGRDGTIGELLVNEARSRTPETIFRALSTCTEVDLVCGLARALGQAFPAGGVTLRARRDLFHRLYGLTVGEKVAARVDAEVEAALAAGAGEPDETAEPDPPRELDVDVVDTTWAIATDLRRLHQEYVRDPLHDAAKRVGRSMSEIETAHPEASPLLVSRCFDYGLAMTTLVPYIDVERDADDAVRVRRHYRVSENGRGEEPWQGSDDVDQELAEETVALIAHTLRVRLPRYADMAVPELLVAQITAILQPLVLDLRQIRLRVRFAGAQPSVELRGGPRPVSLESVASSLFALRDGGIVPTARFVAQYEAGRLGLERRGCIDDVESCLGLLLSVLGDEGLGDDERDRLLTAWATSTDGRLGVTRVRDALDEALGDLTRPLNLILRGEPAEADPEAVARARAGAAVAGTHLAHLRQEWAAAIRDRWPRPNRRERRLLRAIAGSEQQPFLAVPTMLVAMTSSVCLLVEQLEAARAQLAAGDDEPSASRDVAAVLARCAEIQRALTSLRADDGSPFVPSDPLAALARAADELRRVCGMLRAFAAATAGEYRGSARQLAPQSDPARSTSVLSADLSASFDHAAHHDRVNDREWKNSGLNLIAQWGKAFGGWERRERKGDDIWLEFADGDDAAVLCGALVQQHAQALRSSGIPELWWGFRIAVDAGQVEGGDGGNTIGFCLDRVAKLAKEHKRDEDSIERVLVTREGLQGVSPALENGPHIEPFSEVRLGTIEGPQSVFVPYRVDAGRLAAAWCGRLQRLAEEIVQAPADTPADDARLELRAPDAPRLADDVSG